MSKRITLKDIAKECEVSISAVSAAFRRPQHLSKDVREQIIKKAREMGYFVPKELKNIGLVFDNFENHFRGEVYNEVILGVLKRAKELNLRIQLFDNLEYPYHDLCDIGGYLVIGNDSYVHLDSVKKTKTPFVMVGCTKTNTQGEHKIVHDSYQGAYELTEYICNCNHKKVAIIAGTDDSQDTFWEDYLRAVKDVFTKNDIPLQNINIIQANYKNIATVEGAINKILSMKDRPTCIMCANDLFAYYSYLVLEKYKIAIPKEISITGFDGITTPYYLKIPTPQLTTVCNDRIGLGESSVDLLIDVVSGTKKYKQSTTFPSYLKIGDSLKRVH